MDHYRGQKKSQKGPENVEKSQKFGLKCVFQKKIVLANSKYFNSYNMMKKKLVSVYNFRTYFFPFTEVEASFSNLLTRANQNFIKPKLALFC